MARKGFGQAAEDHRAFDQIAQFAHISGPVVTAQFQQSLRIQTQRGHAERGRKLLHEHRRQFDDILRPVLERRHRDLDHIHAVIEVGAETPLFHRLGQVGVGGEQEPQVQRNLPLCPVGPDALVFQHPQKRRL